VDRLGEGRDRMTADQQPQRTAPGGQTRQAWMAEFDALIERVSRNPHSLRLLAAIDLGRGFEALARLDGAG
jgi:hypothetical protein